MLHSSFKSKFPFVYDYFETLLGLVFENKRDFPQSIIFEGADTKTQYLFALELARILNCIGNKENDCDCINCKWIKSQTHPAINNVSERHFKGEGDETKTVISAKQAREIEKNLALSSDYHRFFIFFSSHEKEYIDDELNCFELLGYKTDIDYSIEPISYQTFHPTTPNALLKSIEEPPKKTTFVFLTKSREEILPTIVSRCQCFKLSGIKEKLNYEDVLCFLQNYPNIDYKKALDVSENIQKYIKENNLQFELVLNKVLEYLKDLIKQNPQLIDKISSDIGIVNEAIKCSRANMSDKIVLDAMFLKLARGY